jgi:hypothetical protein
MVQQKNLGEFAHHYFYCYNDERTRQLLASLTPTEAYGEAIKKAT